MKFRLARQRRLVIIVVAVLAAVSGLGFYLYQSSVSGNVETPANAYYRCHHSITMSHARCVTKDDNIGCFGYYDLRTWNGRNGIKVDSDEIVSATCEGYAEPINTFFDKEGNYISS